MWDIRSMCDRAKQGVVSQELGSAPALSIPLNSLSSLMSLQLSLGLFWHPESSQTKRYSAETGFHGEVFGNPISIRARECSLRTSALLSNGCCKQGTGTLCYTQGPRTAQRKQTFANPALCLGSSTRALTSRLPALPLLGVSCLGSWAVQSPVLSVLTPHRVPLCSCGRQGARVL